MIRAHRIRLNPTTEQAEYLTKCADVARFTWNWALGAYNMGVPTSYLKLEFNRLREDEGFAPFVGEVQRHSYQYAFQDFLSAVNRYWSLQKAGKLKPPIGWKPRKDNKPFGWMRFKSRFRSTPSFGIGNDGELKFYGHEVFVSRCPGRINMSEQLRFDGKLLNGRISFTGGHWYLSVQVELPDPEPTANDLAVGIDLGIKYRAVTSDGVVYDNPKALYVYQRKLAKLQRSLSRMTEGSSNYEKRKAEIAKIHTKIANIRREDAHEMTTELTREYGLIGVEDLDVKGMVKNRKLAKAVSDAGMYQIRTQLEYKTATTGGKVVKVDRWFASSKTCSACGEQVAELPLSIRTWVCPTCGAEHERDGNAAINIRNEAVRLVSL